MSTRAGRTRPAASTRFGLTAISIGASLALYELGLFGSGKGPLTPARLGERLAGWGLDRGHLVAGMGLAATLLLIVRWSRARRGGEGGPWGLASLVGLAAFGVTLLSALTR
jgi:hypothetical protein